MRLDDIYNVIPKLWYIPAYAFDGPAFALGF